MARRKTAKKPAPIIETRQQEIVEPEFVTPFAFERLASMLEAAEKALPLYGDGVKAYEHLREARKTVDLLRDVAKRAEHQLDALMAHSEELRTACDEARAATDDADAIRDAIERSYHTRPGAWNEAVTVARNGGDIAPILTGGYYL